MPADKRETILRSVSLALNMVGVGVCLWISLSLWNKAGAYYAAVGGMPALDLAWLKAFAASPDVAQRILAYAYAWVAAIFSAGAALLGLSGVRHVAIASFALLGQARRQD